MNMMNGMMDMKGNIIEVEGMKMESQVMDMNTVMYPEITGDEHEVPEKPKSNKHEHPDHNMQMPKPDNMQA
jgi:hypothetical protein